MRDDTSSDRVVIDLGSGMTGYLDPFAIESMLRLMQSLEAHSVDDVLDALHIDVVTRLITLSRPIKQVPSLTDVCLKGQNINLRLLNPIDSLPSHTEPNFHKAYDVYELQLFKPLFTARVRSEVGLTRKSMDNGKTTSFFGIEVSIDSVSLSLRASNQINPLPAMLVRIDDICAQGGVHESSTVMLRLQSVTSNFSGIQASYLYAAARRLDQMTDSLTKMLSNLRNQPEKRLQDLIYALARGQEDHVIRHEPSCITRPSYVLRSSPNHVRVHNSWKLNTRIRHIFRSLPLVVQHELEDRCNINSGERPEDAHQQVLDAFDRWRGWEMANISKSLLMKCIYGDPAKLGRVGSLMMSMGISLHLNLFAMYIDPGPTQQEAVIDGFVGTASITHSPSLEKSHPAETSKHPSTSIILQGHCRNTQIQVTWEILELFEVMIDQISQLSRTNLAMPASSIEHQYSDEQYQIIFTADSGSVRVDTVNLRLLCMGHRLKTSAIVHNQSAGLRNGLTGSILVQCLLASTEVSHQNRVLIASSLRQPILYSYLDQHCVGDTYFNTWKVSGSCDDFLLDIREEIAGLIEVVEIMLSDEISQLYALMSRLAAGDEGSQGTHMTSFSPPRRTVHLPDVVLRLESFSLSLCFLPSLIYIVSGEGLRLSTKPKQQTELILNFDLTRHKHEVRTGLRSHPISISLLEIPAINGRVRRYEHNRRNHFEFFSTTELIDFDASAIQSLLNALNKPEILSVIDHTRREIKAIQEQSTTIFGAQVQPPEKHRLSQNNIVYQAHLSIVGVRIHTRAPSASFEFNLGSIQMQMSNVLNFEADILELPVLSIVFNEITVELSKYNGGFPAEPCGHISMHASLHCSSKVDSKGKATRMYVFNSQATTIDLYAQTASTVVDVARHLQDKLKDLDLSPEVKYLKRLRKSRRAPSCPKISASPPEDDIGSIFGSALSISLQSIRISWIVGNSIPQPPNRHRQNLILSLSKVSFESAVTQENEAGLIIEHFLLQMVDEGQTYFEGRAENSALLPEIAFKVIYQNREIGRCLALQAKGSPLDLTLDAGCMLGVLDLQGSFLKASDALQKASSSLRSTPVATTSGNRPTILGKRRIASVSMDADFAGAVVFMQASNHLNKKSVTSKPGRFGQFIQSEANNGVTLRSPGLAFKIQYLDPIGEDPSISGEIKISGSTNILYPSVVPLLLEISDSLKSVVREPSFVTPSKPIKEPEEDKRSTEAVAILGKCKFNLSLRIQKQEFSLSCQPYARVAATASYRSIYVTLNTCEDADGSMFYSIAAITEGLRCSLQHIYSRESTGHLEVESLVVSVMNNRHLSGSNGLSCIAKMSPLNAQINVKQIQDFLLFREIWIPESDVKEPSSPSSHPNESLQLMQKYHKVTATKAFPWNTTVSVTSISLQLDLGPSLGKTELMLSNFWVSSKKSSDWEQTMCMGLSNVSINATGRLSGIIEMVNLRARTSIQWQPDSDAVTPLVEASLAFEHFRVKAVFDYQAFLIADIASFDFLMFNLREANGITDRLIGVLEGDKVQIFCTSQSAAQALALQQAFLRLWQEKMTSYESSLKDIEKFIRRRSHIVNNESIQALQNKETLPLWMKAEPTSLTLHTDVVVNLREFIIGAFPSTFQDSQVFKLEALNVGARFAVDMENCRLHSQLGMKLGQLRVGLSSVRKPDEVGLSADIKIDDIVVGAAEARGGTILKVPEVNATMHTWHSANSNLIDYTFKSAFEGKVDVGWNYARVSFIKG